MKDIAWYPKTSNINKISLCLKSYLCRVVSVGYYTNYILLALFLAAAVLFMGYVNIIGIRGFFYDEEHVELTLPFKKWSLCDGEVWSVGDGNGDLDPSKNIKVSLLALMAVSR